MRKRDTEKHRLYMREWITRRREQGLCYSCNTPVVPNRRRCAKHLAQTAKRAKKYKRQRLERGLCVGCGTRKPQSGYKNCRRCLDKMGKSRLRLAHKWRFGGNRATVVERDNHQCQICHTEKSPVVHHIDGRGRNQTHEIPNNALTNLIVLCRGCHGALTRFLHAPDMNIVLSLLARKYPSN